MPAIPHNAVGLSNLTVDAVTLSVSFSCLPLPQDAFHFSSNNSGIGLTINAVDRGYNLEYPIAVTPPTSHVHKYFFATFTQSDCVLQANRTRLVVIGASKKANELILDTIAGTSCITSYSGVKGSLIPDITSGIG